MEDKRILYVSSEVVPYLAENEVSLMSYDVPKMINDQGGQIRIFMPRYGNINERRHQLHEVIRLSGMNLVVNDLDMPLIIKVASIPKERIQVYFIDNDEYFKRNATFTDEDGVLYPDNDERAIFFAKGVVETVKKLNWVPDIIHVHGWMASLLPKAIILQEVLSIAAIFCFPATALVTT
jgi:starch synthase